MCSGPSHCPHTPPALPGRFPEWKPWMGRWETQVLAVSLTLHGLELHHRKKRANIS